MTVCPILADCRFLVPKIDLEGISVVTIPKAGDFVHIPSPEPIHPDMGIVECDDCTWTGKAIDDEGRAHLAKVHRLTHSQGTNTWPGKDKTAPRATRMR